MAPRNTAHAARSWMAGVMLLLALAAGAVAVRPAHAEGPARNFSAIESTISPGNRFAEYFLKPSANGDPADRNVIVLAQSGSDCHVARIFFANTTGVVVTNATSTVTPDLVWVWQMVCGDATDVRYELEYVYAVPASGFGAAEGVEISEDQDGDGNFDRIRHLGFRHFAGSSPLPGAELITGIEQYKDASGETIVVTNWTRLLSPLGESLAVNGLAFDDAIVDSFLGFGRVRMHARGIGVVREFGGSMNTDPLFGGQTSRDVIYYRVNGRQGGSLAGTPYAGAAIAHPWFAP